MPLHGDIGGYLKIMVNTINYYMIIIGFRVV